MRRLLLFLAVPLLALPALAQGPLVFINGDTGVSGSGGAFAFGAVGMSSANVSKHDETAEMARELLKSCPEVSLTTSATEARPDYLLLLSHSERYYSGSGNQVMVLRPDKSVVFASKKNSVSHVTKDGCKAIMADWKDSRSRVARKSDPPPQWQPAQK